MKKQFVGAEIELVSFSTDVISTSPDDGFWLPTDTPTGYSLDLDV